MRVHFSLNGKLILKLLSLALFSVLHLYRLAKLLFLKMKMLFKHGMSCQDIVLVTFYFHKA